MRETCRNLVVCYRNRDNSAFSPSTRGSTAFKTNDVEVKGWVACDTCNDPVGRIQESSSPGAER